MTPLAEILLYVGRDYRVVGGPEFSTGIVATAAGREQRNQNWEIARGRWQLGERHIKKPAKDALQDFSRTRAGLRARLQRLVRRAHRARLPDPRDMAQLAISAAAGSLFSQPALGWAVGAAVGGLLFAPKEHREGPRLEDLSVQASTYGQPIPRFWG
ncbi:MAG: DUF2460 domain-containing protein, partial [Gammaproteobacteria bacterium]|nr:DUF2460 domain-containing protein [Gammaproteobacteria bacterium]